jgi:hypothetical protein
MYSAIMRECGERDYRHIRVEIAEVCRGSSPARRNVGWEPNTEAYCYRKEALVLANSMNIYTWISLEPVLKPDETLWIIRDLLLYSHTRPKLWKLGKLNYEKSNINWKEYLNEATKLLNAAGQEYIVKKDLLEAAK